MNHSPKVLFKSLKAPAHAPDLIGRVLDSVRREQGKETLLEKIFFSFLMMLSASVAVWGFFLVQTDGAKSGFGNYFSLIFTDFEIVTSSVFNWTSILLETLPALSLAILFLGLAGVLESARVLGRHLRLIRPVLHHTF